MSDQPERRNGDPAVALLTANVDRLATNVEVLTAAHDRGRRFSRWLAASVVFDILLSVGLGYNAVRTNDAVDQAREASSATRVACEANNATAAKQKALWDFAFGLGTDPGQTEAQKARSAEFRKFVDRTFTQEEC